MVAMRNACKTFVGKPQGKIPLGRLRHIGGYINNVA